MDIFLMHLLFILVIQYYLVFLMYFLHSKVIIYKNNTCEHAKKLSFELSSEIITIAISLVKNEM